MTPEQVKSLEMVIEMAETTQINTCFDVVDKEDPLWKLAARQGRAIRVVADMLDTNTHLQARINALAS